MPIYTIENQTIKRGVKRGNIPWNKGITGYSTSLKGKKRSEEFKIKDRMAHLGKKMSEETRQKMSESSKGFKHTKEFRIKMSERMKGHQYGLGRKHTEEYKKKMSEVAKKNGLGRLSGKNHYNWKGGKSFELYGFDWTKLLKHSIRTRDYFVCQICNKNGWIVHHIDYNKKNNNPDNLITLCPSCHTKTNHNRDYWTRYFQGDK